MRVVNYLLSLFVLFLSGSASAEQVIYAYCVSDSKLKNGHESVRYMSDIFPVRKGVDIDDVEEEFDSHIADQFGFLNPDRMVWCPFSYNRNVLKDKREKSAMVRGYDVRSSLFVYSNR